MSEIPTPTFADFGLIDAVLAAVNDVGYETPTPIQIPTIPHLLAGRDVVGQAQTGTGKTAAFALPLLSRLDLKLAEPQVLVLTPTRELAIQVAEAFQSYASHLKGFHVLPVYGGQDYAGQLRQLKRGVHVIVGTPGRLMDHMRRGTLKLGSLKTVVLDEADEMLRMGFIEDVEWILGQTPAERQVALFSATMPSVIRRIAKQHLRDPAEITIKLRTTTAETIHQRYWVVTGVHKLDALTRLLETEPFDAVLVFVRTRIAAVELAERLQARGYATSALNGDMPQKQREQTIARLKSGTLDILVATDVAARGLDVERISHVINFDIPNDTEAYVHRIGRTGRAGRSGEAILFVAPRERHMLRAIERATRQQIEPMELPSADTVNDKRIAKFTQHISDTLGTQDLAFFRDLMVRYQQQHDADPIDIAAALAQMVQGDKPLLIKDVITLDKRPRERERDDDDQPKKARKTPRAPSVEFSPGAGKELFRVEVGRSHGVQPKNLVGAIANEAGVASANIGRIEIYDDHSTIELPEGMPKDIFMLLKKVWVSGRQLSISRAGGAREKPARKPGFIAKKTKKKSNADTKRERAR
ncbi:MAG TPA: DEAD/DEAH box helicase [Pseudomonadales bacterium]